MASTEYGNVVNADNHPIYLPDGNPFSMTRHYTPGQAGGVAVLAVVSCISAISLLGRLVAMAMSAWNTRKSTAPNLFVRSHVAAYFLSLLFCEVAQTIGSIIIMSLRWVHENAVSYEAYCTVQGVFKHFSDVGTACWSLVIAMNTFWILFLRRKPGKFALISTVVVGWGFIIVITVSGPTDIQRAGTGLFYAISGYWCWISDQYPTERITMDYMIMFLSAFLRFVIYTLVFFHLCGDILGQSWRLKLRLCHRGLKGNIHGSVDRHVINIARGMLLYPVAYTVFLLPITVCRFAQWSGHQVPFGATIFSNSIFLLSGFVDVVLFLTTRRVLPMHTVLQKRIGTLFPSFNIESFSATGDYSLASYAIATQSEKPMLCEDSDGTQDRPPPPRPAPHSSAQTSSSPPTQYTESSPSTSGTFDPTSQYSAGTSRHSSDKEADIASALHDTEIRRSRVVSDSPSLMIFIPSTALR